MVTRKKPAFLSFLFVKGLLLVLSIQVHCTFGQTCFQDMRTPKLIQTTVGTVNDIEAITKNSAGSTIYVGGVIDKNDASGRAAMLAAIDATGSNGYKWRKLYQTGNMMTITGIAVNGADTSLAVHGSEAQQSEYQTCCAWSSGEFRQFGGTQHSYIFTVNTLDGGFSIKPIKVTHPYSYMVTSSGMVHSNNKILMALTDQSGSFNTSRQRLRYLQVDTDSLTTTCQVSNTIGTYGSAYWYVYDDTVILGGQNRVHETQQWSSLLMTLVSVQNVTPSVSAHYRMYFESANAGQQGQTWYWMNDSHTPVIDHIRVDTDYQSGSTWIFGTTGHCNDNQNLMFHPIVFAHKLTQSSFKVVELSASNEITSSFFVGLYDKLLDCSTTGSGGSGMCALVSMYRQNASSSSQQGAYAVLVSLEGAGYTALKIAYDDGFGAIHQTVFTDTVKDYFHTFPTHSLRNAWSVGSEYYLSDPFRYGVSTSPYGVVYNFDRFCPESESTEYFFGAAGTVGVDNFESISSGITWSSDSTVASDQDLTIFMREPSYFHYLNYNSQSEWQPLFCSAPTALTVSTGSYDGGVQSISNGMTLVVSFTGHTLTSPTCTDMAFEYFITPINTSSDLQEGLYLSYIGTTGDEKIQIRLENNLIPSGTYQFQISGTDFEMNEYIIANNLPVCIEACGPFTLPTLVDQTYNIGDPKLTYTADPFVPTFPGGGCTGTWSQSASIESAAQSIFTVDNSGAPLVHEFYAADNSVLGIATSQEYIVSLALTTSTCFNGDLIATYKITVNNPCGSVTLSFLGTIPSEFGTSFNVQINAGAYSITWTDADVDMQGFTCDLVWSVVDNQTGIAPVTSLFTVAAQSLGVDMAAASVPSPATYVINVRVEINGLVSSRIQDQFTVTFIDACASLATISFTGLPSEFTTDLQYQINSGTHQIAWSSANVVISGGYVCDLEWQVIDLATTNLPDASLFTISDESAGVDISATSMPSTATYNIELKVWLKDNTAEFITDSFQVTFIDVCATTATLAFDTGNFPTEFAGFDYTIGTGSYTVAWSAAIVTISGSGGHPCSLDWSVTDVQTGLAPDSSLFTISDASSGIDVEATTKPTPDTYTIDLKVTLTADPTKIISTQFQVTFIDPCDTATLTFIGLPGEFTSGNLDYQINSGVHNVAWSDANVQNSEGAVCSFDWSFVDVATGLPPDVSLFTANAATGVDILATAIPTTVSYTLQLSVQITGNGASEDTAQFTVTFVNNCVPSSVTAGSPPSTLEYVIGTSQKTSDQFGEFTPTPSYCGLTYGIEWTLMATNTPLFTLNSNRTISVQATDQNWAQSYQVTIYSIGADGVRIGGAETYFFVDLRDPCSQGTFTLSSHFATSEQIIPLDTVATTFTLPNTLGGDLNFESNYNDDTGLPWQNPACPTIIYQIQEFWNGAALDATQLLTYQVTGNTLSYQSTDISLHAISTQLKLEIGFGANYIDTHELQMQFQDAPASVTMPAVPTPSPYYIGTGLIEINHGAFVVTPSFKSITGYAAYSSPALSSLTYDSVAQKWTVNESDLSIANTYTIGVDLTLDDGGTDQFSFTLQVLDPCFESTFTISNAILTHPNTDFGQTPPMITYTIDTAAIGISLDDNLVSVGSNAGLDTTQLATICNFPIQFKVVERLPKAVLDDATRLQTVQSIDIGSNDYTLQILTDQYEAYSNLQFGYELVCRYDDDGYQDGAVLPYPDDTVNVLPFDVFYDDPCLIYSPSDLSAYTITYFIGSGEITENNWLSSYSTNNPACGGIGQTLYDSAGTVLTDAGSLVSSYMSQTGVAGSENLTILTNDKYAENDYIVQVEAYLVLNSKVAPKLDLIVSLQNCEVQGYILPELGGPEHLLYIDHDGTEYEEIFAEFVANGTQDCGYEWTYKAYLNGVEIVSTLNEDVTITFDSAKRSLTFSTLVNNKVHLLEVIGTLSDRDQTQKSIQMQLVVTQQTIGNTAPFFPFVPSSKYIERNVDEEGRPMGQDVYELFLGVPFDNQLDQITSSFSCKFNCSDYTFWNETEGKILVQSSISQGKYTITMNLYDDNEDPKQSDYEIKLEIVDIPLDIPVYEPVEYDYETPTFAIRSITPTGLVEVRFSQNFMPVENVTQVDEQVLSIEVKPVNIQEQFSKDDYWLTWELVSFYQDYMEVQVHFEHPTRISSDIDQRDLLLITVLSPEFFRTKKNGVLMDKNFKTDKKIPMQFSNDAISKSLQESTSSIQSVGQGFVALTFANNVLLTGALNYLWGMINCLQLIAFFPLLKILMPANAKAVFQILINVATFDLVPVDSIIDFINDQFDHLDEQELPKSFNEFDYESTNPISNLEFVFLFILFLTVLPVLLKLAECVGRFSDKIKRKIKEIKETMIYWNFYIRFVTEAYLEMAIASQLRLAMSSFKNVGESVLTVFAGISLLFLIVMCVGSVPFLMRQYLDVRFKYFKQRYGSLTAGLHFREKAVLFTPAVFMLQRLLYALLCIVLRDRSDSQVQILVQKTSLVLIFQGWVKPKETPLSNGVEVVNQFFTLLCTTMLFTFQDFVPDPDTRYMCGWGIIGLMAAMVIFNVLVVSINQLLMTRWKLRLKWIRRKKRQEYAKRRMEKYLHDMAQKRFTLMHANASLQALQSLNQANTSTTSFLKSETIQQEAMSKLKRSRVKKQNKRSVKRDYLAAPQLDSIAELNENQEASERQDVLKSIDYDSLRRQIQDAENATASDLVIAKTLKQQKNRPPIMLSQHEINEQRTQDLLMQYFGNKSNNQSSAMSAFGSSPEYPQETQPQDFQELQSQNTQELLENKDSVPVPAKHSSYTGHDLSYIRRPIDYNFYNQRKDYDTASLPSDKASTVEAKSDKPPKAKKSVYRHINSRNQRFKDKTPAQDPARRREPREQPKQTFTLLSDIMVSQGEDADQFEIMKNMSIAELKKAQNTQQNRQHLARWKTGKM